MDKLFVLLLIALCEGTITNENIRINDVIAQEVKKIVMGVKTSHDIPDELKFLPEFYNQPNPGLYTDQQITDPSLRKLITILFWWKRELKKVQIEKGIHTNKDPHQGKKHMIIPMLPSIESLEQMDNMDN